MSLNSANVQYNCHFLSELIILHLRFNTVTLCGLMSALWKTTREYDVSCQEHVWIMLMTVDMKVFRTRQRLGPCFAKMYVMAGMDVSPASECCLNAASGGNVFWRSTRLIVNLDFSSFQTNIRDFCKRDNLSVTYKIAVMHLTWHWIPSSSNFAEQFSLGVGRSRYLKQSET